MIERIMNLCNKNTRIKIFIYLINLTMLTLFFSYWTPIIMMELFSLNIYKIARDYFFYGLLFNPIFSLIFILINKFWIETRARKYKKLDKNFNNSHLAAITPTSIMLGSITLYLIIFGINYIRDNLNKGEELELAVTTGHLYGFILPFIIFLIIILTIVIQIKTISKVEGIAKNRLISPVITAFAFSFLFIFFVIFVQSLIIGLIEGFMAFFGFPG